MCRRAIGGSVGKTHLDCLLYANAFFKENHLHPAFLSFSFDMGLTLVVRFRTVRPDADSGFDCLNKAYKTSAACTLLMQGFLST